MFEASMTDKRHRRVPDSGNEYYEGHAVLSASAAILWTSEKICILHGGDLYRRAAENPESTAVFRNRALAWTRHIGHYRFAVTVSARLHSLDVFLEGTSLCECLDIV